MKLFLCSHFSSVGSLIKEEIENKKIAFIPTASLREGYSQFFLQQLIRSRFTELVYKEKRISAGKIYHIRIFKNRLYR